MLLVYRGESQTRVIPNRIAGIWGNDMRIRVLDTACRNNVQHRAGVPNQWPVEPSDVARGLLLWDGIK